MAICLLGVSPLLQGNLGRSTNEEARLLAAHNRVRTALGIPSLSWNPALAADAATWAAHLAHLGEMEHYTEAADVIELDQGENLAMGTRDRFTPEELVALWADEGRLFRQGVFPENSATGDWEDVGHFTQLVWRSTRHVGCAMARGDADDFLVCRYSDAGNVEGERPF